MDITKALLKKGGDVNITDGSGRTPLELTTDEEIKTLLRNKRADDSGLDDDDTQLQQDDGKENGYPVVPTQTEE